MKFWRLIALLVFAIPALALAQDDMDGLPAGLAGTYAYDGVFEDGAYEGSVTLTGTGPIYWLSYQDHVDYDDDTSEEEADTSVALAQGNVVAAAFGGADCAPSTLMRQSDGTLFGQWVDPHNSALNALGAEYAIPQAETTGFVGTYDVVGTYANGLQFKAVATISENDNGWLDVVFQYSADEMHPEDASYQETGIGLVSGNVLGIAYTDEGADCAVYVVTIEDDAFSGLYADAEGASSETGSRVVDEM